MPSPQEQSETERIIFHSSQQNIQEDVYIFCYIYVNFIERCSIFCTQKSFQCTIAHSFQQQNLMKMNNLKNASNLYFQVKLQSSLIVSYETLQRKRSLYNVLKLIINSLHIHKKHWVHYCVSCKKLFFGSSNSQCYPSSCWT